MSAVPQFAPGWWNAWWFLAFYLALALLAPLHHGLARKLGSADPMSPRERRLSTGVLGLLLAAAVYSVGCPLQWGTWWLYLGGPLGIAGLLLLSASLVTAARTPEGQPFTTGPYRCSRHPMVVFGAIGLLGAGIAAASWLLLLLVAAAQGIYFTQLGAEEHRCLAKYGEAYRAYQQRTPKYLGWPRRPVTRAEVE